MLDTTAAISRQDLKLAFRFSFWPGKLDPLRSGFFRVPGKDRGDRQMDHHAHQAHDAN